MLLAASIGALFAALGFVMADKNVIGIKTLFIKMGFSSATVGTWAPLLTAVLFWVVGTMLMWPLLNMKYQLLRGIQKSGGSADAAYSADSFERLLPSDSYAGASRIKFPNDSSQ